MIPDLETNTVYYSHASNYDLKEEVKGLKKILQDNGIDCNKIIGTKDYFCRDYMPVQKDLNTFIQFRFHPDYLLNDPEQKKYVTNVPSVKRQNAFLNTSSIINSDIILDGGNIIKWKDKVIITDKVFDDNRPIPKNELIDKLSELLGAQVIIIPKYPIDEPTGHADGLVRFKDADTVLTICLDDEPTEWTVPFRKALEDANLKIISFPKYPKDEEAFSWGYINYLHVGKLIILPTFLEYKNNEIMIEFFKKEFEGYTIRTLPANRIIENGGVLNCFTWNIQV